MIEIVFRADNGSVYQFHQTDGGKVNTFFANSNSYSDRTIDVKDLYDRYMRLKKSGWRVESINVSEDELFMVCLSYC